ncbi:hypothetical protein BH23BAC1_BH23BAC1_07680 [soil metagenome]
MEAFKDLVVNLKVVNSKIGFQRMKLNCCINSNLFVF